MSTAPAIRAYLGGSFNPVHQGHIQMAMHVYNALADMAAEQNRVLEVSLLPNARSPFKEDTIDPAQRLAMLTLAIQDTPLHIEQLELWQTPPVYSIDSVRTLHERYPNDSLIFIMGMDSARSLDKWKNGLQLTDYVHLWIFNRNDDANFSAITNHTRYANQPLSEQDFAQLSCQLPLVLQGQVTHRLTDITQPLNQPLNQLLQSRTDLKNPAKGRIYIDPRPVAAISSTRVREQLTINITLPNMPLHPYNPPNLLAKWLNPTVYQYIIAHQLYSAA
ncbi:nicotinate-nicotinamide nucleotide adenylyltransferase [Psychrobacter sp. 16-MNA-CIBAN-0192]|uniref:nicotinate-nicotinamide nucleotide adenylyltransferase n=1 Tax=Psychrobacter sp. 16-MNA-CIBAN-0192 TaxID=3140448 RepID=UPI003324919C